jgi:hypothetical protein
MLGWICRFVRSCLRLFLLGSALNDVVDPIVDSIIDSVVDSVDNVVGNFGKVLAAVVFSWAPNVAIYLLGAPGFGFIKHQPVGEVTMSVGVGVMLGVGISIKVDAIMSWVLFSYSLH